MAVRWRLMIDETALVGKVEGEMEEGMACWDSWREEGQRVAVRAALTAAGRVPSCYGACKCPAPSKPGREGAKPPTLTMVIDPCHFDDFLMDSTDNPTDSRASSPTWSCQVVKLPDTLRAAPRWRQLTRPGEIKVVTRTQPLPTATASKAPTHHTPHSTPQ